MDRSTREREISGQVGRCGWVESQFTLVFILIFLDSHYWCCQFDLLQHSVSRSQPSCCNIPSQLVATPISSCCNTLSQLHCKTSLFSSITVLQHPISTHRVVTPRLNLPHCNTVSTLATPHLNPPRCNTWSQPATLQSTLSTFNIQPSYCNTILTCFTATSACNFLKSSLGLFPPLSLFCYLHSRGLLSVILNKLILRWEMVCQWCAIDY